MLCLDVPGPDGGEIGPDIQRVGGKDGVHLGDRVEAMLSEFVDRFALPLVALYSWIIHVEKAQPARAISK